MRGETPLMGDDHHSLTLYMYCTTIAQQYFRVDGSCGSDLTRTVHVGAYSDSERHQVGIE